MFKFWMLILGCWFIGAAFVSLIMWGVMSALVNFYPSEAAQIAVPSMVSLVLYNTFYSLELAAGLFLVKKALK